MGRAVEQEQDGSLAMLAEGALRNLHLDCRFEKGPVETFSSRMLHLDDEGLVIADPARRHINGSLDPGVRLICSGRLGRDIFRFACVVAGRRWFQINSAKRVAALLMTELAEPAVIQRRRYFRVSLAGHELSHMTCWVVEQTDDGARVIEEFSGQITDVSGGGVGVVTEHRCKVRDYQDKQLWARFMLPGENESMIFRIALRHVKPIEPNETYHLGLEFIEYIDPGQHTKVVDNLFRFVSKQERVELRRRKDR